MPLIINEMEVNVAPDAHAPGAPPGSPPPPSGLTPQHVLALIEKTGSRAERLRAH